MSDLEEARSRYERSMRPQMINQAGFVWRFSRDYIEALIKELCQNLAEADSQNHLQESYRVLNRVTETLIYGKDYLNEEDPLTFKELIGGLVEVFKCVFESFLIEDHAFTSGDKRIDDLKEQFYESLKRKRRLPRTAFVSQAYPPITLLIRMLRNCQEHEREKPVDHITRKNSFGNVYTVSSVIILTIYAYSEILQAWLNTIKIENSPSASRRT